MTRTIIFDFDGTLAIGHGPVLAYAKAVAPAAGPQFVQRIEAELASFDTGNSSYRDGYHVVADLAAADGVSPGTMNEAYTASRDVLGTPDAHVVAPDDLAEILTDLRAHAHLVLATNAPAVGVTQVLSSWGVDGHFDRLHANVGKPAGLYPIIREALEDGSVLAIGDIVDFDLQPALDLGADTALVGATARTTDAPVTLRGPSLTELREPLVQWASTPDPR